MRDLLIRRQLSSRISSFYQFLGNPWATAVEAQLQCGTYQSKEQCSN
jgi:hypothetical protein